MTKNRFFARSFALLACVVATIAGLAAWQYVAASNAQNAASTARTATALAAFEHQRDADLVRRAELVADDAAFVGYVELAIGGALPGMQVDTTSLVDLLGERQRRLGFSLVAVLDQNGRVVGSTSPLLPAGTSARDATFIRARDSGASTVGVWQHDRSLFHIAVVPLAAVGVSDGLVLVALPVGQDFANDVAAATGAQVVVRDDRSGVVASTLPPGDASALAANPTQARATVDGARRALLRRPLFGSKSASTVLAVAPPEMPADALLPWAMVIAGVIALWVVATFRLWRRVFAPAELIAQRLERARAGDAHLQITESDAGALSRPALAFNQLMQSLRA